MSATHAPQSSFCPAFNTAGLVPLQDSNNAQAGMFAFSEPEGNLCIQLDVNFAQPESSYDVFLIDGSTELMAAGFVMIGTLATNALGFGRGTFRLPHATLVASPFGRGHRADYIKLIPNGGTVSENMISAGTIRYFVCDSSLGFAKEERH